MNAFRPLSSLAIYAAALLLLAASAQLKADTYQIFDLGFENGHNLYGIDSSGAVVTIDPYTIVSPYTAIYRTWVNGVVVATSFTPPVLNYDNGISCVPTVSVGITISSVGRCNNGHEVYMGTYLASTSSFPSLGIFTGPNLSDLLPKGGALAVAFINSSGDIAWIDGLGEEFYSATDLTTRFVPEPGSLLLLATGTLAFVGALRRRLS